MKTRVISRLLTRKENQPTNTAKIKISISQADIFSKFYSRIFIIFFVLLREDVNLFVENRLNYYGTNSLLIFYLGASVVSLILLN